MSQTERIKEALTGMSVGFCGVKWDHLVWRVSESGWQVGELGVRRDGFVHDLESIVEHFKWKRGIKE